MPKLHDARTKTHLHGFERSRSRRRKAVHGNRWALWATGLYVRHARIADRLRGLALVLARNQLINLHRVSRWYHKSPKLFSQLRLSLGPFFLRLPSDKAKVSFLRLTQQTFEPHRDSGAQSTELHGQFLAAQHFRSRASTWLKRNESPDFMVLSPTTRVGTRLTEIIQEQWSRFETRSMTQQFDLVNRVIDGRRRFEVQTRRNLINRDRWEHAKDANVRREPTVIESEHTARSGSGHPNRMAGEWPLDLERLTDQVVRTIDSRIVAHRERTGNVF